MADLLPRDTSLGALSEAVLAEVERALAQAEQAAAALEQRSQDEPTEDPATVCPEAAFAQVAEKVARLGDCVQGVAARAGQVDDLLRAEEAALAAWRREAWRVGETLAEWAGRAV